MDKFNDKPFFSPKPPYTKPPLGRCFIVTTPLCFFLSPNLLPLLTPARLDPTKPHALPSTRALTDAAPLFLQNCKGLFHQKTLLLSKTEFE